MKQFRFLLTLIPLLVLLYCLDRPYGKIPPLGPLLDPYHGCWQNAEKVGGYKDMKLTMKGLRGPVQVVFDDRMVPHIFAQDEHDLYMAQGYVTAQLRLWQMEIQTHAAAGRVSEILGDKFIETDRFMRRNGLKFGAEKLIKSLDRDEFSKSLLEAYSDGINAWIDQLRPRDIPVEYKLLNYRPEHWTTLKTALLLKQMAYNLNAMEYDIEHSNALKLFGKEACAQVYRDYWPEQDPIIPKGTVFTQSVAGPDSINPVSGLFKVPYDEYRPDVLNGSNNWAISGKHTASGRPILANDPHLKLSLPSIWMEIQLCTPDYNVYGVSLPGSPGVVIGFNQHIAWGVTNAGRDVRDWYSIEFRDQNKNEYKYNGGWKKTEKVVEEIKVKNGASYFDTIIYTHHGPVVYDGTFKQEEHQGNLALRWVSHDASDEFVTFHRLNMAKNIDDYFEAISHYSCPAQNFVFACVNGDIAIQQQGKFPIEHKNQSKFVQDGSDPANDITRYIPFKDNPHIVNPERGFVSSANQHPTDTTYPYAYDGTFEYFRNRRINSVLVGMKTTNMKGIENLQLDNYNLTAASALPTMIRLLPSSNIDEQAQTKIKTLKDWNFMNGKEQLAPALFEAWFDTLGKLLWDEFEVRGLPLRKPEVITTIHFITDTMQSPFYDIQATAKKETLADLIKLSFDCMCSMTKETKDWGKYKNTMVQHLAKIPAFSSQGVYCSGNKGIVNATNATHGPSWRMIVEMTDEVNAEGVFPGGQSGNPGSPYYDNMIPAWAEGKYFPLLHPSKPEDLKGNKLFTLELQP